MFIMKNVQTINKQADLVNEIIHQGLDGGKGALKAYIMIQAPIFANPFGSMFLSFILFFVEKYFYKYISLVATNMVIDIQVNGEKAKAYKACNSLMNVLNGGDQNAIDQANKDFNDSYSSLIHYDGNSTNAG